jgi:serine/threonine-protein kinase
MSDIHAVLATTAFRVDRMLAVGGMAEIYLAREALANGEERQVVLKRLLPQYRDDEELATMFFDEARVGEQVRHPHVVQVHGALRHGRDCLIVMEYVPGCSLTQLLAAARATPVGVLPEDAAAEIARSLAETLHFIHSLTDAEGRPLCVVHRDLNPSNVLVSRAGVIKLIDFGIARGENRVHETATGMLKGTVGYMAPEQLESKGRTDARTDVFALGVVMYELFVGRHPFATKDLLALHSLITEGQFTAPAVARPGVPAAVDDLIRRCLQPDPVDRPFSMSEVAKELVTQQTLRASFTTATELARLVDALVPEDDGSAVAGVPGPLPAPASSRSSGPVSPNRDGHTVVRRPRAK